MNYFITGTDTDVGKTYFTALLTRAARRAGLNTVAVKPLCCGPRDDVTALCDAGEHELTPGQANPIWLTTPAAPLIAARQEGRNVSWEQLISWFSALRTQYPSLLVEGAGGWLVPITPEKSVADLAEAFGLPVLVVVANRLGCLNHTLLTVESIRARGLTCAGLVLNSLTPDSTVAAATNKAMLAEICSAPILFEITPGQTSLRGATKIYPFADSLKGNDIPTRVKGGRG